MFGDWVRAMSLCWDVCDGDVSGGFCVCDVSSSCSILSYISIVSGGVSGMSLFKLSCVALNVVAERVIGRCCMSLGFVFICGCRIWIALSSRCVGAVTGWPFVS